MTNYRVFKNEATCDGVYDGQKFYDRCLDKNELPPSAVELLKSGKAKGWKIWGGPVFGRKPILPECVGLHESAALIKSGGRLWLSVNSAEAHPDESQVREVANWLDPDADWRDEGESNNYTYTLSRTL